MKIFEVRGPKVDFSLYFNTKRRHFGTFIVIIYITRKY